ncbi:MAG: ShlB/FhaC/HecB family hemolysin secretion/activation protein [Methylomonas sp.]|nr:ShlB/FhaC/HecB family hemolysin secretion/activation protein [Methylomonas sp.]PPD21157.1 MAG: peptidase S9 [Methylomonas sp.]PPD27590.1 MAG: peptidase S9 [Methylomonas sp.]PPD39586.1 MAG: peptidase S9 [Methylomonas sp.]PPD55837.1 MAG: peptidase S9 [Methylomonas sp.]
MEIEADTQQAQPAEASVGEQAPATFDLFELRVKGNTLLDKNQLERTIYPFLGPKKSIDNVEAARTALEELYRAKGYQTVAVDIPEQDVREGVVYLQVVEGKVARLRVKDARYFDQGRIIAAVPELAEGNVPNFPRMQKQLAELAMASPDRQIVPVLRAGETPGTLEVDLKVKDEIPVHGKVELNGRNVPNTTRLRLVNSLRYDNLWQRMHSASLMYQVSPEKASEVDVWAGTYAMPVFDSDARLALYAVSFNSTAALSAMQVIGAGRIYGARLVKPLKALDDYFHSFTAGVDYKDFKEDLMLLGADTMKSPVAYLPFMLQYGGTLRGSSSLTTFDAGARFSVRGLGNDQEQFENRRFLARSNYAYLVGNLKHQHTLPADMELVARFSGQISDSPLIANEQFSLGGDQNVRGYFETQALADDAVFGSLELYSPHLAPADWDYVNDLKLLAFVDAAQGWIKHALPGNVSGNVLTGAGVGLRFKVMKHLVGNFDVGVPFTTLAPVSSGDPRLHFSIAGEF